MQMVIYYAIEALKLMSIYVLGFHMTITKNKGKQIVAGVLTLLMGISMNFLRDSIVYPGIYIFFILIFSRLLITDYSWKKRALSLWAAAVILSMDSIGYVIEKLFPPSIVTIFAGWNDVLEGLLSLLVLTLLFYFAGKRCRLDLEELSVGYYLMFLAICIVNTAILLCLELESMLVYRQYVVIYILLIVSFLAQMVFVLFLASNNQWHEKNKRLQESYLNLQKEHYQYLQERNVETKKFRHDIRAHMYALRQYAKEDNQDAVRSYIDELCGKLEQISEILTVQNEIADAILNYYAAKIQSEGGTVVVKGSMPAECHVQAYDLCTIFSNMLSNAYEAMENAAEKRVELQVFHEQDSIFIREANTFANEIRKSGKWFKTSKADKKNHGFGMKNMEEAVKKYGGTITTRVEENEFIIEIFLKNCENKRG